MKSAALVLLAAVSALAQSVIDYTKVPSCARQCTILDQAEKNCVPPAAPAVDQGTYQSCFCNSGLLTPLHSSGSLCQPMCNVPDAAKVTEYYNALCAGPVVVPPADPTTTTTSAATGTATSGAGAANRVKAPEEKKSWFSTHWQWVVMVIIIFLAIVFFWVGGIYLRRYLERKADAKRANMAATDAPYIDPKISAESAQAQSASPYPVSKIESQPNNAAMTALPPAAAVKDKEVKKMRSSRSSMSLGLGGSTKTNTPQGPVVWGPHQHLAHGRQSNSNSPGPSVPPSPTYAVTPPAAPWRNREAVRSDPRFSSFRGTQTSVIVDPTSSDDSIRRPQSTRSVLGEPVRDVKRQTLSNVKSDPGLGAAVEAQSAMMVDAIQQAPKNKLQKHQR